MSTIQTERITLPAGPDGVAPWLSCRVAGPKGAPLLVFLHGFPEAAFVWDDLVAHFAGEYRCVAPNLRGYPGSFAPAEAKAYRANVVLSDLLALIAHEAPTPTSPAAAVIAHDWGGALAWGLAAVAPQSLQQLVILNAPHPALFLAALRDDHAQQASSAYMNMLRTPGIELELAADDFAQMWTFFERFGGATWLTPELRAQYRQAWSVQPEAVPGVNTATSALTGPLNYYRASPLHPPTSPQDAVHTLQLPPSLTQVNVPVDVIWGEADTALPPSLLNGLEQHVPQLRITRLAGASHWLVHEAPVAVRQAIEVALHTPASPLIDAAALQGLITASPQNEDTLVIDCRFNLAQPSAGQAAYDAAHIGGAVYAHLERDLSSDKAVLAGQGRHPLPAVADFERTVRQWGITPRTRVVAYDDAGGMFAARLWWMLRWVGHDRVQVLDGGWQAWQAAQGETSNAAPAARPVSGFQAQPRPERLVSTDAVLADLGQPTQQLIDARAPDRFRGENETMDPVGGHIPGARNRFFQLNLASNGRFKPAEQLRAEFTELLGDVPLSAVVHQCGSGVTACHNLLAMAQAGLDGTRLYGGSWSAWCADPSRPMAR